jgi:hypothetical protein
MEYNCGVCLPLQTWKSGTLPTESFAHDCGCALVCAQYSFLKDLQTPTVKEETHHYSSQYNARFSACPDDLEVNLTMQPDNRQLQRHMPNDLPPRLLVQLSYL